MFLLITGCSSLQNLEENNFKEKENNLIKEEINKIQKNEKDYEEIKLSIIEVKETNNIPKLEIEFDFTTQSKLYDLLEIFNYYKINTIVDSSIEKDLNIPINRYRGNLKDLLSAISETSNISFEYKDNFLKIMKEKNYSIKIIQDKEIIDNVITELEKLNLTELIKSDLGSNVNFKTDYKKYKKILKLINEINNNTSLINIELSIINIELNENDGNGFDWSTLNIAANLTPENFIKTTFGISSEKIAIGTKNHNSSIVMNLLSEYGQTEILQSTSIRTLSSKEAKIKTTETTPFLSEISQNTNGEFIETGYKTDKIETGLEVTILPFFDKETKMINIKLDLNKSTLKNFMNVSGNDFDLSQPNIEQQSFNSVIRLKAGETSVIGGIIYSKEKIKGNNIGLKELTQSNKKELTKNSIFIILRPTVKSYIFK